MQGVVPGANACAHAKRLLTGVGKGVLQGVVGASEGSSSPAEIGQAVSTTLNIDHQGLLQRFSAVLHLDFSQLAVAAAQQLGSP